MVQPSKPPDASRLPLLESVFCAVNLGAVVLDGERDRKSVV